jgi:hypothetical protein
MRITFTNQLTMRMPAVAGRVVPGLVNMIVPAGEGPAQLSTQVRQRVASVSQASTSARAPCRMTQST